MECQKARCMGRIKGRFKEGRGGCNLIPVHSVNFIIYLIGAGENIYNTTSYFFIIPGNRSISFQVFIILD